MNNYEFENSLFFNGLILICFSLEWVLYDNTLGGIIQASLGILFVIIAMIKVKNKTL